MGAEDVSRNGKRKVCELCGPDGARRSIAVSFGIWAKPRLAPEERCYEPEYQGTDATLGHRANATIGLHLPQVRWGKRTNMVYLSEHIQVNNTRSTG
jgi:hypothetical protein